MLCWTDPPPVVHGFTSARGSPDDGSARRLGGMHLRVEVRGPASAEVMWSAYADTSRWSGWAPQIRRIDPEGPLVEGMEGQVHGPWGTNAHFEVSLVDRAAGRWAWRVHAGPAHLGIHHEVADGVTAVEIQGPAPFVLAYAPVARLALERLARSTRD